MTMIRKVMPVSTEQIADNRTRVTASTNQLARDGHILEPAGLKTDNFLRSGVALFDHDPKVPVATPICAQVDSGGTSLAVEVEWPPAGVCAEADRVRGLVKAGVIRAVSIGFEPIEMEPLDPKKPRGGQHITSADLLELSFVSVPADTGAVVTQRSKENSVTDISKGDRSVKARHARFLEAAGTVLVLKRGLYQVACLAQLLEEVGYAHACSEWEAEIEGDDSPVPAMIGESLVKLGEAFIAMAKEEATELLAGKDLEIDDDEEVVVEERAFVAAGKTPRARAWRRGIAMARAGKTLSASNAKKLDEAQGNCERALKHHKALGEHNSAVSEQVAGAQESTGKAQAANTQVGESLAAAKDDPENAQEHVKRAAKAQKAIDGHLTETAEAHTNAVDRCQDVGDAHNGIGRSIKSAQRCMRSVVDGSTPGAEDGDSKDVQKSGGDSEDDGSERSVNPDFRRRQAEALALIPVD